MHVLELREETSKAQEKHTGQKQDLNSNPEGKSCEAKHANH